MPAGSASFCNVTIAAFRHRRAGCVLIVVCDRGGSWDVGSLACFSSAGRDVVAEHGAPGAKPYATGVDAKEGLLVLLLVGELGNIRTHMQTAI